jgi:hypothetical protein
MNETTTVQERALSILKEFSLAQTELQGKGVILTNGVAGTVVEVHLDDLHGLKVSIEGHEGQWPISTFKSAETD